MGSQSKQAVAWSFWVIAGFCFVWNLMGVMAYLSEFNAENMASLPDAQRALIEQRPPWATAAFAVAVWGGALGCLLLLARKAVAFYVLVASLAGVIVQMCYNLFLAESTAVYGPFETTMAVLIPLIAVFLVWYSKFAQSRGWIS